MSKFLLHGWVILLFISAMSACSLVPNELTTAEQLIETAPDSALHILQHLSPTKYKSATNQALFKLLLFEAKNRKKIPLNPDSLKFSIEFYQNHPDKDRLATCYFYQGRAYKYSSQYEKAMVSYLKALDEAHDSKDNILLGRINFDMGDIDNIQGDYKVARQKYSIAFENFSKAKFQPQAFYSQLNIGRTYHESKDYKTAQSYYYSVIPLAKDSLQQGALYQEIGLNFYDFKKIDSALYYYKKAASYPYLGINRSIRYSYLADLYFEIRQYDSAYYFATNSLKYEIDFRTQRDCYRVLTNCQFLRGHMLEMSMYMNKYVALGDSLRKVEAQIKGSYMETTHIAKKEATKNKYIAWYMAVLALLIVIAAYFLYRFITQRSREEKQQLQQTHTGEKVGIHKKVIEDKRVVLQQQIENHKKQMLTEFKNSGSEEREKQLKNIYKELLHYDEPVLFYQEMNKFLNGLITKLRSRYSTLNENEIMLCCYLLLHIPTYDMLLLFGYKSDDGLKTLKRRLSKRLNLENATVLEDFLLTLLAEN